MVLLTSNNTFGICDTSIEGHDIISSIPGNGAFVMYVRTGDMIYTVLSETSSSPASTMTTTDHSTDTTTSPPSTMTTTNHSTGTTTEAITTSTTTKYPNVLKTVYIKFETDTYTCNPNDVLSTIDISGHKSNQYINYESHTKVIQSDTYTFVPLLKYPYTVKYADSGLFYTDISKDYGIGICVGFYNDQPETLQLVLKFEDCEIQSTATSTSTDTTTSPASTMTTTNHSTDTTTSPASTMTTTNHSTGTTTEAITTSFIPDAVICDNCGHEYSRQGLNNVDGCPRCGHYYYTYK